MFAFNPAGQQVKQSLFGSTANLWPGGTAGAAVSYLDGQNKLTLQSGAASANNYLLWDGNGNLASEQAVGGGTVTNYTHDSSNRLTYRGCSNCAPTSLSYDPLDRLFRISNANATTRFAYDGDRIVAEYNDANQLVQRYVPGAGTDETLTSYLLGGTRTWLYQDERGSVVATANDAGTVTANNTYDPYGKPASANTGRFQYTGQAWIPDLGLYYYKARFYSPTYQRFLETDPIGEAGGINLYAYASGDPVNRRDPSGLTEGGEVTVVTANRPRTGIYRALFHGAQVQIDSFQTKDAYIEDNGESRDGAYEIDITFDRDRARLIAAARSKISVQSGGSHFSRGNSSGAGPSYDCAGQRVVIGCGFPLVQWREPLPEETSRQYYNLVNGTAILVGIPGGLIKGAIALIGAERLSVAVQMVDLMVKFSTDDPAEMLNLPDPPRNSPDRAFLADPTSRVR